MITNRNIVKNEKKDLGYMTLYKEMFWKDI